MGNTPAVILTAPDLGEALVGLERVAAGGDEIDRRVEIGARQSRIGRGGAHFVVEFIGEKRLADRAAENVLRQHVERAGAQRRRILGILGDGVDRRAAFEHLEAVGRHQHGFRGLIEPVVGAPDALQETRTALGRPDINDQIDVAPVDAQIKRRRAHHRAQLAPRHGVLDFAPLRHIERTVMQRNGEVVVVDAPQLLENPFSLAAGVDEDERRLVRLYQRIDFAECMQRRMPGPGQMLRGVEHGDLRLRAGLRHDKIGECVATALRHEIAAQVGRARQPSPTGRPW